MNDLQAGPKNGHKRAYQFAATAKASKENYVLVEIEFGSAIAITHSSILLHESPLMGDRERGDINVATVA